MNIILKFIVIFVFLGTSSILSQPAKIAETRLPTGEWIEIFNNGTWKKKNTQRSSIVMGSIPAGTFTMGSPATEEGRAKDEIQHQVTLSGFKMSRNEITVGQYREYCTATGKSMPTEPVWGWDDELPMCNVTWVEAQEYAKWQGGRLPTEAEWEYACRAGTTSRYWFGDKIPELANSYLLCNMEYPRSDLQIGFLKVVLYPGRSVPLGINDWNLINMPGSMNEWCNDWYGDYIISVKNNPQGAEKGDRKVVRVGSWFDFERFCRSAARESFHPETRSEYIGFRIVKSL